MNWYTTTSSTNFYIVPPEYLYEFYHTQKRKVIEKQTIFIFDEKDCDKWPVEKN